MYILPKIRNHIRSNFDTNTSALLTTFVLGSTLRLGSNIILAKLLFPEAFAIVGMIASIFYVLELSSDLGFRAYIIRNEDGEKKVFLDTLWTIRLIRGFVLALVIMASSPYLADFFGSEELQPVLMIASLTFALTGFEALSYIVSERRNLVSKVLYLQFFEGAISIVFMIVLSYFWRSYWPLVIGMIVGKSVRILFSYLLFEDSVRSFRLDGNEARKLWDFSKIIIPASMISIVLMQGEKIFVVRALELSEAGVYFVAVAFSAAAFQIILSYPRRVLYPVYSKAVRDDREILRQIFYHKKMIISSLFALGCGLGIGGGDLFFAVLYDERYAKAGYYLSILLILPLMANISYVAEVLFTALGEIKVALISNILRVIWLVPAVYIGRANYGTDGVIIAFSLMEVLPILYFWFKLIRAKLFVLHKEILPLIMGGAGIFIGLAIVGFVSK